MGERPDSHLRRRALLAQFRQPLERTYPVETSPDEEQDLQALLEAADQRKKAATDPQKK